MTGILNGLSNILLDNVWIAPLLALLAGVFTSLTPCSLSSIPLVIAYVGGTSDNTKKSFRLSLVFALGSAVTFTGLGVAASLLGHLVGIAGQWWYIALGTLMILMALQVMDVFQIIPSTYLTSKSTKTGYLGAFVAGILGGLFSSPCATPVLVVLLAVVAQKGSIAWGTLLLLLYSIGNSFLVILAGTYIGIIRQITRSNKYGVISAVLKYVTGLLIAGLGAYMLYLGF